MTKEAVKSRIRGLDKSYDNYVFYTTLILVFVGIVMVFSASYVQSKFKLNDPYYFLKRDLIYATLGFVAMMFT